MLLAISLTVQGQAEKLCIKKMQGIKNNKVRLSRVLKTETACPANFIEVMDTAAFQTPPVSPSIENINIVLESCQSGGPFNYSGTARVDICESAAFTKFSEDTFLEIVYNGGVTVPSNMMNGAAAYGILVKQGSTYYSPANESGEVPVFDSYGPAGAYTPVVISGVFSAVPAGQLSVIFYVKGVSDINSGEAAFINPGNYRGSTLTVREIRVP